MCLLFIFCTSILIFSCLNIELISKGANLESSNNQLSKSDITIVSTFSHEYLIPEVPDTMMVYQTVDPQITEEDMIPLLEAFNIDSDIVDRGKQFVAKEGKTFIKAFNREYGSNYKILEVFNQPGTGYLRFTDTTKQRFEDKAENLPSKDEAIDRAEAFLRSNNLLPENAFFTRVGYDEFEKFDSEGSTIETGVSAISVAFGFTIDGMKVEGSGAKITVTFGDDSEIISVLKCWREIKPDQQKAVIPLEEVFRSFKDRWPKEAVEPKQLEQADLVTKVTIKEIYIAYYTEPGCIPQNHIKPVYVFKGNYKVRTIDEPEIEDCDTCDYNFIIFLPAVQVE
jgi:hypothetical protein